MSLSLFVFKGLYIYFTDSLYTVYKNMINLSYKILGEGENEKKER